MITTVANQKHNLFWIATAGLVGAGVRGVHDNHHLGSLLVDPYWVGFYVTNFQDGFRRRALIGSLCRLLQPHGMSVLVINCLAVCALLGVLGLFIRSMLRLVSPGIPGASLFLFSLFSSALCSVYFEVLGDTLQIAFLVFACFMLIPAMRVGNEVVRLTLAFLGLVLAFFVHEASVFLLAPCIPYLMKARVRAKDFILPALAIVLLVGLSVHWSHLNTHLTYHAVSIPHGISLEDLAATPSLLELIKIEIHDDFSTRTAMLFFLVKCGSILVLALAGLIAFANCFSPENLPRAVTTFVTILLFSSPLWIIAHDWGRFMGYTFLLTALAASTYPDMELLSAQSLFLRLTAWVDKIAHVDGFRCAALLILLVSPYYQSRIFGMHIRDFLSSLSIIAVGLFALHDQHPWRFDPAIKERPVLETVALPQ